MINVLAFVYATIFSGSVLAFVRHEYPKSHRLTVRGNRLFFLLLLIGGFVMAQIILRIYVNCDLTNSNSVCEIYWN